MPISEAHMALLKKQSELVNNLRKVVQAQQRALEQLGAIEEDYEHAEEKKRETVDTDNEGELAAVNEAAKREARTKQTEVVASDEPNVAFTEPTEEEERAFAATKPWLGAMAPPSDWSWDESRARDAKPNVRLELEHVHGYRARGVRNNIAWVDGDKVVYPCAGVVVVMTISTKQQKFFRKHEDDILCMDYNPAKRIVASGEQGKNPALYLWNLDDQSEIACFRVHKAAVSSVAISPDGSRVVSVGLDNDHSIAVHDIVSRTLVVMTKGDSARIISCAWNTTAGANSSNEFVTVGVQHIKFWTVAGGSVSEKKGLLGNKGERQGFLSVSFTNEHTLIACEGGQLYCFDQNKLKDIRDAHNGAVFAVATDSTRIVTGGRDGFVNVWDRKTLKNILTVNLNSADPCSGLNSVRALWLDPKFADRVMVGTITSSIYAVDLNNGTVKQTVQAGHFGDLSTSDSYGELWGLSPHPTKALYATVGEDKTLRIWDIAKKECVGRVDMPDKALCCAYSPDGNYIAVGFDSGKGAVYNTLDRNEVTSFRKTNKRIQSIKYSPCGKYLALGSAANTVYLFQVDGEEYQFKSSCTGNSSVILHVDFSADSKYLQTCSQAYELLFYEVETGKPFTKSRDLRDTEWATFSSILGWSVQGIWPAESDGSDINKVNKSRSGKLLATAEDSGLVKVFNYPCVGSGLDKKGKLGRAADFNAATGHSEHVTSVEWTVNDTHVISTGGADNGIFQWKVVMD